MNRGGRLGRAPHEDNMQTKYVLELAEAIAVLEAAKAEASLNHWAVSIAVVDDAGQLILFQRMPGAPGMSIELAIGKAKTSTAGSRPTKAFEDMVNDGRFSFTTARELVCVEGGVPLVYQGQLVGAIGVSGVRSFQDAAIALVGAQALA